MSDFVLSCCSTADLTAEHFQQRGISYICFHYELDGKVMDEFPFPALLAEAKPVMEYKQGWKCDISGVRTWEDLPQAAKDYVTYVEEQIGCHIGYVSVGPERDSIIVR